MDSLPLSVLAADISPWVNVQPEVFFEKAYLKTAVTDFFRADKLLKYSRLADNAAYDLLAYRITSATPVIGAVKLQSINSMRASLEKDVLVMTDDVFELLKKQEDYLVHRPIEMFTDGRASYKIVGSFLELFKKDDPEFSDIRWVFPLSYSPKPFIDQASGRDFPQLITQQYNVSTPELFWLPLNVLLNTGSFKRMQDFGDQLTTQTSPGNYYCFISHRWLSPVQPDPDNLQAQMLAWQLISYLSEAIRIAKQRGLMQPRKFSEHLGFAIGISGSNFAESIVVNVLRYHFNEDILNMAFAEIESLPLIEEDYGIIEATNDTELLKLNQLLRDRPILKSLSEKFFIWYDYSCMPQRPFKDNDFEIFTKCLDKLNVFQVIGQTLIMLDSPFDYLGRAWCTLESVYADAQTDYHWFTIAGSPISSVSEGMKEYYFSGLLEDRPHIIWRAILDTELFELQTPKICMERLGLATTEKADLLLVYQKLKELRMPVKIHTDDCEIITGVFPLPFFEEQNMLLFVNESGSTPDYFASTNIKETKTLSWNAFLDLSKSLHAYKDNNSFFENGYYQFSSESGSLKKGNTHVCICTGCEGEGLLISNWLYQHVDELELVTGLKIMSLSWIASDIAPVGKMINAQLKTIGIDCVHWIFLGTQMRFTRCTVPNMILNCVRKAGKEIIYAEIDNPKDNVRFYKKTGAVDDLTNCTMIDPGKTFIHNGGLFRWALTDHLIPQKKK